MYAKRNRRLFGLVMVVSPLFGEAFVLVLPRKDSVGDCTDQ
jgi:hypothetical protein